MEMDEVREATSNTRGLRSVQRTAAFLPANDLPEVVLDEDVEDLDPAL
jgi:hypothetical protein